MSQLPTGTVTFLFTDIEGSTRRWETDRAGMSAALARHDALLRAAIEDHDGRVFKTVGDAFCAAFAAVPDALRAALDAQRALAAEDWAAFGQGFEALRVRMALHAGRAEQRDGDWFGPPLNRVARLLAAGHGAQVLLSLVAAELLQGDLPPGTALTELGEHRLKDLGRPERIYQLLAEGLPSDFPPLRSLDHVPNNLPQPASSFVGRERELARARSLLEGTRLLTLTGIGGAGKTRLALQLAADTAEAAPDGTWFIDLAPLTDPALVPQAVADALDLREEPGRPLQRTLQDRLGSQKALLLLDNCEHLIEASAELVAGLLGAGSGLRVLATSREPLFLAGETIWAVPPLGDDPELEQRARGGDLAAVGQNEAVQLFLERARAVRPDFALSASNAAAVVQICARLDGTPLAIELAAARVRHLPPEQILARLDDRFRLLAARSRGVSSRQQTLRAAIDWSHDLLTEPERQLFHRLSVFRGGWSLEAAEAICAGEGIEDWEVLDLLGQLVDRSLVVAEEQGEAARYRLLETLRSYAAQYLRESGSADDWQRQQAEHFLALAERKAPRLVGPEQHNAARALSQDGDNLRAALDWSLDQAGDAAIATRLAAALWRYWNFSGRHSEGRARYRAVLLLPESGVPARERAIARYAAAALLTWGKPRPEVFERYQEAMAAFEALDEIEGLAWCHNDLGLFHLLGGNLDKSEEAYTHALMLKRRLGEPWDTIIGLTNLAEVKLERGKLAEADALVDEARDLADRYPERISPLAHSLIPLMAGDIAFEREDVYASERAYGRALHHLDPREDRIVVAELLARLGWTGASGGEHARAARLLGAADRQFEHIDSGSTWLCFERHHPAAITATRAALGKADWQAAYAEGRAMTVQAAVALALESGSGPVRDRDPDGGRAGSREDTGPIEARRQSDHDPSDPGPGP